MENGEDMPDDCQQPDLLECRPLMTKTDIAELLERTVRTVYRLQRQGKLPGSVNIGSQRVWSRKEVTHWIDSGCPSRREWERLHPEYKKVKGGKNQ